MPLLAARMRSQRVPWPRSSNSTFPPSTPCSNGVRMRAGRPAPPPPKPPMRTVEPSVISATASSKLPTILFIIGSDLPCGTKAPIGWGKGFDLSRKGILDLNVDQRKEPHGGQEDHLRKSPAAGQAHVRALRGA